MGQTLILRKKKMIGRGLFLTSKNSVCPCHFPVNIAPSLNAKFFFAQTSFPSVLRSLFCFWTNCLREGAIFTGKWQGHDDYGARTYFAKKIDGAKTYFAKKIDWAHTYFAKKNDWAKTFFSKKFDWAATFFEKKMDWAGTYSMKKIDGAATFPLRNKKWGPTFFVPQMMGSRHFFTEI